MAILPSCTDHKRPLQGEAGSPRRPSQPETKMNTVMIIVLLLRSACSGSNNNVHLESNVKLIKGPIGLVK